MLGKTYICYEFGWGGGDWFGLQCVPNNISLG